MQTFSKDEIKRYSRHLILPEVGISGQRKLKDASVLCIGIGGLGSPLSMYLAAAGVGRIGLVDFDLVDYSNLQRQILYSTVDVGKLKLEVAAERLRALNPEVEIVQYNETFNSRNALKISSDYDIIADGTDNFPTRYLANDVSVLLGIPNVYTSIFRFEGQATVFHSKEGPCYRCLYPEPPPPGMVPNCAEGGVLGILPGIMGTIQASEVIKLILGVGKPLIGRLLLLNALDMSVREIHTYKDPECPICGERPTIHELTDYEKFCGVNVGSYNNELESDWIIQPEELASEIIKNPKLSLIDVRNPPEWEICNLPNVHLIPEQELPSRLNELDKNDDIVVYCKSGVRSSRAVMMLKVAGFKRVRNLNGGIQAWSEKVDQSIPKY
ncbi:molybdopterin-synthase adenylyltransferase MoeB [Candidatus Bathyarchaeota archaeon]|nr:molybdopterin-synthase adenylyltransferase MoeB [Candidatus Bathyarchaeota archaeon]